MDKSKDFDYYKKLHYDVIVRKQDGRYRVFIPELSLAEEDTGLNEAYEKVQAEKDRYFQNMIEWGYSDYIKEPMAAHKGRHRSYGQYSTFFVKFAIVLTTVLLISVFAGKAALNTAPPFIKNKIKTALSEPDRYLIRLNEIADSMTDEKKENIRISLRKLARSVQPYATDLRGILDDVSENDRSGESKSLFHDTN